MRFFSFMMTCLLLAMLVGIVVTNNSPEGTMLHTLKTFLEAFAEVEHLVQEEIWQRTSPSLLALLGLFKCLYLLLALWGSYALWMLLQMIRRGLNEKGYKEERAIG